MLENYKQFPFLIGVFHGTKKPEPLEDFLDDFISEMKLLQTAGFLYNGIIIKVKISVIICDAPARSMVKFSPLCTLGLGMVSQFPLDYMHLVCLGVVKKIILAWVKGPLRNRLSSTIIGSFCCTPDLW
uniref:Uncharacterized protein n=1 Tax=Ciona savignyi TaxID=51511 RepID=H2Y7T6_CIOSA